MKCSCCEVSCRHIIVTECSLQIFPCLSGWPPTTDIQRNCTWFWNFLGAISGKIWCTFSAVLHCRQLSAVRANLVACCCFFFCFVFKFWGLRVVSEMNMIRYSWGNFWCIESSSKINENFPQIRQMSDHRRILKNWRCFVWCNQRYRWCKQDFQACVKINWWGWFLTLICWVFSSRVDKLWLWRTSSSIYLLLPWLLTSDVDL